MIMRMFREFLVHHHSSLEYRAKILTLMISSDGEMDECEKQKLKEIAFEIYKDDPDRAEVLIDTVTEFHNKIVNDNGLDYEHLILQVARETREVRRFADKIDIDLLKRLHECIDDEDEDERIFQERIIEFLQHLKEECGGKNNAVA
jgi:uncharacterized tellurite resistance protein B-like protein